MPPGQGLRRWWREQALAPSADFLPDFCNVQLVFLVVLVVELMALVLALAQAPRGDLWQALGLISLFMQWVALTCTALLCALRRFLAKRPLVLAALFSYGLILAMTALFSLLALRAGLGMDIQTLRQPDVVLARNLGMAGIIGAVALRYFYLQQQYRRRLRLEAEARVQALQARIHPHFLFNSMNTIASLIRRDPATAERVVEDLSELFRAALGGGQGESTLGDEIELAQRYLAIERLRLGERLQVRVELADDVPMAMPMPRLILQPLVENAIVHGIARLDAGGEVLLQAWCDGDALRLRLSNPTPREPGPASNAHALASIAQRLVYRFGPSARVTAERDGGQYRCELWLPLS